jgi:hypothetical protein
MIWWIVGAVVLWLAIGLVSIRYWDGKHAINMIAHDVPTAGLALFLAAVIFWPIRTVACQVMAVVFWRD